ncbi:Alpha/Beta hydrolase protein [Chlamydoabsidia padenii]|nr:Alpha/Beta hydrolase protein [Chlamydoabsidia padenii]
MAKNLALTLYFNWTMVFYAPLSALATVVVYPTFMVALLLIELFLKLFMDVLGGQKLILFWSQRYGNGLSIINWGQPSFLLSKDTAHQVKTTLPLLSSGIAKLDQNELIFDISIAQTMTVLSALVYERDGELVKEAYDVFVDNADDISESTEEKMRELLSKSEQRIREIAEPYGLRFEGISELKSLGGPFCGVFWSETYPCLIVCFKGTTPTNYEEFLVDCSIQRADARPYLFGAAHQGFYDSVFPTTDFGENDKRDPYQAILNALHEKAKKLYPGQKVQVWVTGHSLGAAMSCLLFARWLKCPEDLKDQLELRDAYVIGTPAVGDDSFASMFASHCNTPVHRRSTLWRVVNKQDLICRLPVGYDNRIFGRFVSKWDFFNYAHVGHEILIPKNSARPLRTKSSSYQSPGHIRIVATGDKPIINIKDSTSAKVTQQQPSPSSSTTSTDSSSSSSSSSSCGDDVTDSPPACDHLSTCDLPHWMQLLHSYHDRYYKWLPSALQSPEHHDTPNDDANDDDKQQQNRLSLNPIHILEHLYPYLIRDHLPHGYYQGLEMARKFYV